MKTPTASEYTALLCALITAQWFSSPASGFYSAAGNAVWIGVFFAGAALALLCLLLRRFFPQQGLLSLCAQDRLLRPFLLPGALLFLLLSAASLRDALSMLSLTLLPRTPRWLALLFVLPVAAAAAHLGLQSILRAARLLAPLMLILYALVLLLSVWGRFNLYQLFPLLGTGPKGIGKVSFHALCAAAWLPLLWLDPAPTRSRGGFLACLWSALLGTAGYLFHTLLFSSAPGTNPVYPLHELTTGAGLSYAFQRTQALFVFVWLPVQVFSVSAGLCCAAKCLRTVFPVKRPAWLLNALAASAALLGFRDAESAPAWLAWLLQTNTQCLLLLPLAVMPAIARLRKRVRV